MLHDLPDLFCELYDGVDLRVFRAKATGWLDDSAVRSHAGALRNQIEDGTVGASHLRLRVANCGDQDRETFTILLALDLVFSSINPIASTSTGIPTALSRLALFVAAHHRLDSGTRGGALLPRLVGRISDERAPDHLREVFTSVLRVEEEAWSRCDFRVLPPEAIMLRPHMENGLRIGCAPLIEDPDEVEIDAYERGERRHYRIAPKALERTVERISTVLDNLIQANVHIGVIPELMLTRRMLDTWRDELANRRGRTGSLQWLLVGSGDIDEGEIPVNAAILLDARTGKLLARQDKLFPFDLDSGRLKLWGLTERLGEEYVSEQILAGDRLLVLDGGAARIAILICEDLARVADFADLTRAFGVSHLVTPVFSRPIKDRRWERSRGEVYADSGATVIVSNSRVMHSILGMSGGTGLVIWPENALVLEASEPDGVASATLTSEGDAVPD